MLYSSRQHQYPYDISISTNFLCRMAGICLLANDKMSLRYTAAHQSKHQWPACLACVNACSCVGMRSGWIFISRNSSVTAQGKRDACHRFCSAPCRPSVVTQSTRPQISSLVRHHSLQTLYLSPTARRVVTSHALSGRFEIAAGHLN